MPLPCLLMPSPVGILTLVAQPEGLCAVLWEQEREGRVRLGPMEQDSAHPVLRQACVQLEEYFNHQRQRFDLPLAFNGTPFQRQVWEALLTIPFGQTRSYQQIAEQIGAPKAVRAVGAANGRNPLSIIAPCHRVVGSNGTLTGFAGGLEAKRWLLGHEWGAGEFRLDGAGG
ncbi:methylated-DNA--[protein]-cysteine S-methyltransferase [Pseudomonas sp. KNUC1026]|uniref:methylated-DNA--[protein]-cysteine S-methyltransferase n=1 Tax=Pseudomonas sp. KNUC1026 TaxID=2893890 RepID=UPI001F202C54|nr:methylated-DNA--[protein]-cysteine S-methyltransferase [Pseudomonas sp. KNUC1026]UFH51051.1 methylated-DNA--[protein]-cysteine S-methyltransferase [Pseudomonas sp. KNUC1026]